MTDDLETLRARTWAACEKVLGFIEDNCPDDVDWVLITLPRGTTRGASAWGSPDPRAVTHVVGQVLESWEREDGAEGYAPPRPQPMCFLYLMARTGLVKIGMSGDPVRRARALGAAAGERVEILATVAFASTDEARQAERQAHAAHAAHRRHGEWFADVPEIHEYFARLAPP